jgi:hypothetical protein
MNKSTPAFCTPDRVKQLPRKFLEALVVQNNVSVVVKDYKYTIRYEQIIQGGRHATIWYVRTQYVGKPQNRGDVGRKLDQEVEMTNTEFHQWFEREIPARAKFTINEEA